MAGNSSHDEYAWYVSALSLVNRVRMMLLEGNSKLLLFLITRSNIFYTVFKVNWNSGRRVILGLIAHSYDSTTNGKTSYPHLQQCNSTSYNNKLLKEEDVFQTSGSTEYIYLFTYPLLRNV
jgi:hypothetical protein